MVLVSATQDLQEKLCLQRAVVFHPRFRSARSQDAKVLSKVESLARGVEHRREILL